MKKTLLVLAIILVGSGILLLFYQYLPGKSTKRADNEPPESTARVNDITNSPKVPDEKFIQTAWLPDWAGKPGLDSLTRNQAKFTTISPVWYEVNEDGSLKNKRPSNASQITQVANKNKLELIPAIAMFDHELFTKVLQNPENLERHVEAILKEVETRNYAGIDLDYESTKLSDKEKYFTFLAKLSAGLKAQDKALVVTVLAQWENNQGYTSLKETRRVQDWQEIAKYADQIRIMTYDYTSFRAIYPGPIAPLSWMRQVLDYAITQIPREKIVLGIHLYSYEWWLLSSEYEVKQQQPNFSDPLAFQPSSDFNLPIAETSARSYTYDTVKKLAGQFGGQIQSYEAEKYYRYSKPNPQTGKMEERLLVYIDPAGVRERQALAREYGIKGVVYWRLGGEAELLD